MRRFTRRSLLFLLALTLLSGLTVAAETVTGSCGESASYSLDQDTWHLSVTGTGSVSQTWYSYSHYIQTATVAEGITALEDSTFSNHKNLRFITLPTQMNAIGRSAFSCCYELEFVSIPQGITEIPYGVFSDCYALTGVELPAGLTTIGNHNFNKTTNLTDIFFHGTQAQWENISVALYNSRLSLVTLHSADTGLGWVQLGDNWVYWKGDGFASGWLKSGSSWYYLDPQTHYMATGLTNIGGKLYYMNDQGIMQTGWVRVGNDWYYFDSDGAAHNGWLKSGSSWYYFTQGKMLTGTHALEGKLCTFAADGKWLRYEPSAFYYLDGKQYFVKPNGNYATGWTQTCGSWYYFGADGVMRTGWLELDGKTYYLDESTGKMAVGWRDIDLYTDNYARYYFRGDGSMHTGWLKHGSDWYYLDENGKMATGPYKVGSDYYCFNTEGQMLSGGLIQHQPYSYLEEYQYFYANEDGTLHIGWLQIGNNWHYFYKDGHMAIDTYIGQEEINAQGIWVGTAPVYPIRELYKGCTKTQIALADAIAQAIAKEAMEKGGTTDYERVKYAATLVDQYRRQCTLSSSAIADTPYGVFVAKCSSFKGDNMALGRVLDYMDMVWYPKSMVWDTIWWICLEMDGEYGYAATMNGSVGFGNKHQDPIYPYDYTAAQPKNVQGSWVKEGGSWYYKDANGKKLTGMHYIGGSRYYFRTNGSMATGWVHAGGSWYYFTASGAMKTGWYKEGKNYYYLQADGTMATGVYKAGGEIYCADQNGKMLTGWNKVGSKWIYANSDGTLVRGYATVNGSAYYFNDRGEMAIGWAQDHKGGWVYGGTSGVLVRNCWKTIGGKTYYFYKDGHIAQKTFIDNHFIDENGVWTHSVSKNRDPQHYKHLTSQQAAQADAIAKAIAQDALANGGKTDYEKITYAAQLVYGYIDQCVYLNDTDYYYRSPYGVFVAGIYTCAGATRAMGRVLEFMGYEWYHPGENEWEHQWVCVKMDGEYGWVEPQLGKVGFGNFLEDYTPN